MLTDSNVANHGAAVSGNGRSQAGSQQQGDARPGLKSVSTNGARANHLVTGNSGPKAVGQSLSAVGGMLKTKTKRERSVSTDSESRNAALACVEPDAKGEGVMRSKRRCVLEKKQPYSGDEWCSGPDTEDDEDKLPRSAAQRGRAHSGPLLGNPDCLPKGSAPPESGVPALVCGLGLKAEPPTSPQTVYVFTTSLANSAAEAVLKGQSDSILQYHQQNVTQELLPGKLSEKSGASPPASKPEGGAQRLPTCAGGRPDPEASADGAARPDSPSVLASHLQSEAAQRAGVASGLSRQQLEHRQRSLQTLRDIERLLLRGEAGPGAGEPGGCHNTLKHLGEDGLARIKSHEEALQSVMSRAQALGGPAPDSPQMDPQNHLPLQLHSPGSDLGHMLGPEGLTPEQVAWRKLQEEYYQEKRRMQEVQPHQAGGMRGPPPPYHSKPGDWGPGMGQLELQQEGPRGPRFMGPMPRRAPGRGGFPGSPGGVMSMEGLGPQRPGRSGMVWMDDLPNTGGGAPYPGYYPGRSPQQVPGEPEHLLTREEIFRIVDKRQRLARQQMGPRASPDFGHMDFRGAGGGPPMRDLGDPLGGNAQMQQQGMLFQKLRGGPPGGGAMGELFHQGERGNKGLPEGFPYQGPFPGGPMEGPFQQSEMFDPAGQMGGHRGPDVGPKHPQDLNVHPLASPPGPFPRPIKSPSVPQAPSPRLSSPSGPGIRSPPHMAASAHRPSRAGTPSSSAMKSPQVLGMPSPSVSPGRLRSPAVAGSSPGWASPKTALPSPGGPRALGAEPGPPLPPRSSTSEAAPSQNPLSLIMSQMSKYAVPSSTPLYHEAIKTIATSDDEMLPDRPLLANVQIGGNMGGLGPHGDPQSPLGMVGPGPQHLGLEGPGPLLPSPNHMGLNPDGMGPCSVSPQLGGFPRMHGPPGHGPLHSPGGLAPGGFPPPEEPLHLLAKAHQRHEAFLGEGPDLSQVIRHTHSGIPEFDLSRIIPSDKPSSTLQYFPKSEAAPSNPHLAHLQNMMAEQQLPPPSHGGPRQLQGPPRGHLMSRTMAAPLQQAMMANSLLQPPPTYGGMMAPQQHGLMARQNLLMLQARQRGEAFGPQGPPQMMPGLMGPQALRQRGVSLDAPLGFGPGGMTNMPF